MSDRKRNFLEEIYEAYEKTKKTLAFIVMFLIVAIETLPQNIFPDRFYDVTTFSSALVLGIIILQVLFEIYEKVNEEKDVIPIIDQKELLERIFTLSRDEKFVSIKYIGIAGRYGWQSVISCLLDDTSTWSLCGKKLNLSVCLLDEEYQQNDLDIYTRFSGHTSSINKDIERSI